MTIAIEDNGIGIPKDALHKLGRPFEQVESQLTKRHQGSGLGLAIAKSLTELHGGRMRTAQCSEPARWSWCGCRGRRASPYLMTRLRRKLSRSQNPHKAFANLAFGFHNISV